MDNFSHDFLQSLFEHSQIELVTARQAETAAQTQEQLLEQLLQDAYNRRTELHRKQRRLARFGFLLAHWAHLKHTEDNNIAHSLKN